MPIFRLYVEKKSGVDIYATHIKEDLVEFLHIQNVTKVRVFNRYDIENISKSTYEKAKDTIFSEPQTDIVYEEELPTLNGFIFLSSYLNGQYDQRADSCMQCLSLIDKDANAIVKTATVYNIEGDISDADKSKIKTYLINPIEKEVVSDQKPTTLITEHPIPNDIKILDDFILKTDEELSKFRIENALAMSDKDLIYFRDYFKTEDRNPTFTELKVVDTYWSDHCRHTTFMTELTEIKVEQNEHSKPITDALELYYSLRAGSDKKICLMDMATIIVKYLKKQGKLSHLVESDEINACTIEDVIEVDGQKQEYLILFKNETHNHPTEIEPYGGAATCLGGAIRDPLSGRAYVYQAMRITGCANPTEDATNTLIGKLPQRQITQVAANGYSAYGNQIGLATGEVKEYYHEGYKAKRLEVGAVVGAVEKSHVKREEPVANDVIVLIGGATGRDGCGGATGSSKEHNLESIKLCGSEVQKGNPVEERKLQRLFRNKDFTSRIKRCNDFGAGGVCVAIGEIANSLVIDLDKVPVKYTGLDGTEIAISESQERMAIAIDKDDAELIIRWCESENLTATVVAEVTDNDRLIMKWREQTIVDISRKFLDSAGVNSQATAIITPTLKREADDIFKILNTSSGKGLTAQFDNTVGANTVLMPYGGFYQLTKEIGMVSKIPTTTGETDYATYMTHGFDPYLCEGSPFLGAIYAIIDSVAKQIALGAKYEKIYLSFQEYFERLGNSPIKWGKPVSALLGALVAQKNLEIGAIGGKDSMSGTFEDLSVPPTFISFACSVGRASNCISGSFKNKGSNILYLHIPRDEHDMPDWDFIKKAYYKVQEYIQQGLVKSSYTIGYGGVAHALSQMSIGNKIGVDVKLDIDMLTAYYGDILIEVEDIDKLEYFTTIGRTTETNKICINDREFKIEEIISAGLTPLENIFSQNYATEKDATPIKPFIANKIYVPNQKIASPKVIIPVFPGTNCEYETEKLFRQAGGNVEQVVFLNRSAKQIAQSLKILGDKLKEANILAFAGGFSAGDEPDGSGKFIATTFRNEIISECVNNLLDRDGLIIGICNGFQVLVKLGLLPAGKITNMADDTPTLTYNTIGKHISTVVNTKITSNNSPWLKYVEVGDCYNIPISHGEGRFIANQNIVETLEENGQIFSQYVNEFGEIDGGVNGSTYNIEGIISKDGRILGKMGHSERVGNNILKNIYGKKDQQLFKAGIDYFK
ncbi:MAG: phosphoribosylformylglycinamidine synthase [Epulopiscium sp. Nuni2H_MBin003]|nr:MAG: phosphoribosylformylglycinamidine synthase [Epulopiscium sp. Nuni2H_MBin003]